jgi:GNAT superfamily N-acetyltransferase
MIGMEISTGQLRLMNPSDLAQAVELSSAAGWNQTFEDWQMLLELSPQGCFAIESDGHLAATTTLVTYQKRLGWIGMVLTKAEYRGRGLARRLLTTALDLADSAGIETIKLDATEQGRPIYERFGFRTEQPVERWSRSAIARALSSKVPIATEFHKVLQYLHEVDTQAFGADRSRVLEMLARKSTIYSAQNGFVLSRLGRTTDYLGPCVASDPSAAHLIINDAIDASPDRAWSWDLMPANKDAIAIASEFGFTRQRCLTRMVRGKPLHGHEEMVYAIAGFELG